MKECKTDYGDIYDYSEGCYITRKHRIANYYKEELEDEFTSYDKYRDDLVAEHNEPNKYTCNKCDEKFILDDMKFTIHLQDESKDRLYCLPCYKTCKTGD